MRRKGICVQRAKIKFKTNTLISSFTFGAAQMLYGPGFVEPNKKTGNASECKAKNYYQRCNRKEGRGLVIGSRN